MMPIPGAKKVKIFPAVPPARTEQHANHILAGQGKIARDPHAQKGHHCHSAKQDSDDILRDRL